MISISHWGMFEVPAQSSHFMFPREKVSHGFVDAFFSHQRELGSPRHIEFFSGPQGSAEYQRLNFGKLD